MKFGLRIPHFGEHCTYDRIFNQARWIEEAGFNSVWVRDQLSFRPHGFEGQSTSLLEPFTTLTGIAMLTKKLMLGTSTIVTYRHPLVTSALFGTLSYISKGRVLAGIGAGGVRASLDAVGLPFERRGKVVEEMLEILRLTWQQDNVSFHGEFYNFDDMTVDPRPPAHTPIYYGGITKISIRRAIKFCDGWLPSRVPFIVLDNLLNYLHEMEEKEGKKISISYSPLTSIDKDSATARKRIGMERILANFGRQIERYKWKGFPPTEENLEGELIVGSPQECVDQLARLKERGVEEVLFDMRNSYDVWEASLELLAAEVLPYFTL